VYSRIGFLMRLTGLKILAFVTFIILALYTPSTVNTLLARAGDASKLIAKGAENSLESVGGMIGDANVLMPKKGAFELLLYVFGLDKVLIFIGLTIALYILWLLLLAGGRGVFRMLGTSRNPRANADARVRTGPPR